MKYVQECQVRHITQLRWNGATQQVGGQMPAYEPKVRPSTITTHEHYIQVYHTRETTQLAWDGAT